MDMWVEEQEQGTWMPEKVSMKDMKHEDLPRKWSWRMTEVGGGAQTGHRAMAASLPCYTEKRRCTLCRPQLKGGDSQAQECLAHAGELEQVTEEVLPWDPDQLCGRLHSEAFL